MNKKAKQLRKLRDKLIGKSNKPVSLQDIILMIYTKEILKDLCNSLELFVELNDEYNPVLEIIIWSLVSVDDGTEYEEHDSECNFFVEFNLTKEPEEQDEEVLDKLLELLK